MNDVQTHSLMRIAGAGSADPELCIPRALERQSAPWLPLGIALVTGTHAQRL
ncbi:hypothetical protein EXIGLDRAFT_389272 [Exidia glandulosa HHB12029]|uniref:Uncharacterized protein n=1 Tax=Exidia glandulosa HHB12029 TaxID=1314781 RepID=A0A165BTQ1_EXIGL|nr:hypothetical protein EXIGLDRAFT_389272 [Exidia glandulosa HHB12029]